MDDISSSSTLGDVPRRILREQNRPSHRSKGMDLANAFTIRPATESDDATLEWLAALAGEPALRRPALIGDVDGMPAAAISLLDGRLVADPFRPATGLAAQLRLHRSGWRMGPRHQAARRHLRAVLPFMV
jgi:hypothetical protein